MYTEEAKTVDEFIDCDKSMKKNIPENDMEHIDNLPLRNQFAVLTA